MTHESNKEQTQISIFPRGKTLENEEKLWTVPALSVPVISLKRYWAHFSISLLHLFLQLLMLRFLSLSFPRCLILKGSGDRGKLPPRGRALLPEPALLVCLWESAHMELREGGHSLINISSGALVCPRALPSESSHSFCSCSRAAACEAQHHLWLLQPPRALLGRSESTREGERGGGGGVGGEKREGASANQRWQAIMGLPCCQLRCCNTSDALWVRHRWEPPDSLRAKDLKKWRMGRRG